MEHKLLVVEIVFFSQEQKRREEPLSKLNVWVVDRRDWWLLLAQQQQQSAVSTYLTVCLSLIESHQSPDLFSTDSIHMGPKIPKLPRPWDIKNLI